MNIEFEIMCLVLGITKTAEILQVSEEALQLSLENFVPENQTFFLFIKDCLLSYVKKLGNRVAEQRLEVSSFVIDKVIQSDEFHPEKRQKNAENEDLPTEGQKKIRDPNTYSLYFKKKVLKFFKTYNNMELTSSKFSIRADVIYSWVKEFGQLV